MEKCCTKCNFDEKSFVFSNINKNDLVVLVSSIEDSFAIPQAMVIKEVLNKGSFVVTARIDNLTDVLSMFKVKPNLVITQSTLIDDVILKVGNEIKVTTFSCLFAKLKGDFDVMLKGINKLDTLNDGDKILIAEGCFDRPTCKGIGRNEIPLMIKKYTNKELVFDFVSGDEFPNYLNDYALVVHCSGCMLSKDEILTHINLCASKNICITNYGLLICKTKGVLDKVIEDIK